ncbi:MAG: lipopolysaccharide transport periplasmic protein LptA [Candidatus Competibacterales bacterium]|nr:lipopolysaccharide transport periplasmic protein LptA [Candidatus Competibacterales bacterium]
MHRLHPSLLALALLVPDLVPALPGDREQPIRLQADQASFEQRTGVSIYEGNVEVSQGSMYLSADKATLFFDDVGQFQRMEAVGSPSIFRYRPSANKPRIDGTGRRIEYNAVSATVVVSGDARFVQGGDRFSGERIEYDLERDVVKAAGTQDERIEFIIQPRSSQ